MPTDSKNAIIGQDELLARINSYTIDTLPHAILLEGDVGCGKHTLCKYMGERFNLEVQELKDNSERKDLDEIVFNPYPTLYIIDFVGVIPKFQNSILKILEEPPASSFFVCLCTSRKFILPTIQNRCVVMSFAKYKRDILELFAWDYDEMLAEIALTLYDTPGELLRNKGQPLDKIYGLAIDVLNRIGNASYPNVLSISDKIAFKNEKGKFDLITFIKALKVEAFNRVVDSNDELNYKMYRAIVDMEKNVRMCISKQRAFEGSLFELKRLVCN